MSSDRRRRQQLYERIRASSADEVILEEMTRLGFWPQQRHKPTLPEALLKRQGELLRELNDIAARQRALDDPERALALLRKERLKAARERRAETRAKRLETDFQRKLAWHQRRRDRIVHLGDTVSAGLNQTACDDDKLRRLGLPALADAAAAAAAIGVDPGELRFLGYHRRAARFSHYRRFSVAKKPFGERLISAPMPRLKRVQYWLLDNVLAGLPVHDAAHGFRPGRSTLSNARVHAGAALVVNHDIKDFFPSIGFRRVKGLFRSFGYSEALASVFAALCTEADADRVELDGEVYHLARGERRLPQGAPTSPAISNLICRRLDSRLGGAAAALGFRYTRYADDMTFSTADTAAAAGLTRLLWRLRRIAADEGFTLHPGKLRIMHRGRRQQVTGLVVNERPAVPREQLRRFRALLHRLERDGPDGCVWNGASGADVLAAAYGFASYVNMVDRERGGALLAQVRQLRERYGRAPAPCAAGVGRGAFRRRAAAGRAPRDGWWQPRPPPAPPPPRPEPAAARPPGTPDPAHLLRRSPSPPDVSGRVRPPFSWFGLLWKTIALVVMTVLLAWLMADVF